MARYRTLITYLSAYFFTASVLISYYNQFRDQPNPWMDVLLFGAFLVLLVIEPWLSRRSHRYTHLYLALQTTIVCVLLYMPPRPEYLNLLFLPLAAQAMYVFPARIGFRWLAAFCVAMVVLVIHARGWRGSLPTIITYLVSYLSVGSFVAAMREAGDAGDESQRLLSELQVAHEELKAYSAQAEELAVLEERQRLAHELHDSVTQSLYSLTLFTEAARHTAEDAGYEGIERQIGQIGRIGLQALKEMRLLVYELRPPELKQEGLIRALRKRMEAVEGRAGVEARVVVDADEFDRLPREVELGLYRIAQEALNNALKHAAATSVVVHLRKKDGQIELEVVDDGLGFEPEAVCDRGGMGLESIRQRAEGLGGTATVRSAPGEGTSVCVSVQRSAISYQPPADNSEA